MYERTTTPDALCDVELFDVPDRDRKGHEMWKRWQVPDSNSAEWLTDGNLSIRSSAVRFSTAKYSGARVVVTGSAEEDQQAEALTDGAVPVEVVGWGNFGDDLLITRYSGRISAIQYLAVSPVDYHRIRKLLRQEGKLSFAAQPCNNLQQHGAPLLLCLDGTPVGIVPRVRINLQTYLRITAAVKAWDNGQRRKLDLPWMAEGALKPIGSLRLERDIWHANRVKKGSRWATCGSVSLLKEYITNRTINEYVGRCVVAGGALMLEDSQIEKVIGDSTRNARHRVSFAGWKEYGNPRLAVFQTTSGRPVPVFAQLYKFAISALSGSARIKYMFNAEFGRAALGNQSMVYMLDGEPVAMTTTYEPDYETYLAMVADIGGDSCGK